MPNGGDILFQSRPSMKCVSVCKNGIVRVSGYLPNGIFEEPVANRRTSPRSFSEKDSNISQKFIISSDSLV